MKRINSYNTKLSLNHDDEVFSYLISNFKETIRSFNFYVSWKKVLKNISTIESPLSKLNRIVGKENIQNEFYNLITSEPDVIDVIPILIACRENNFKILEQQTNNKFGYKEFSFNKKPYYSPQELVGLSEFCNRTGLLEVLKNQKIKNVVDYVIGVEVGLDSNARKNRTGSDMEKIVEFFIKDICKINHWNYLTKATVKVIKHQFNQEVAVDKSNREFDFAINAHEKLYLIETNYYNGSGSKLKSVAGEFKSLFNTIKNGNVEHGFIWITDGIGWNTAINALSETFANIDYILNLDMIENGILEDILINKY